MSDKPTYEELEQRVRELERAEIENKKAARKTQEKFRLLYENAPCPISPWTKTAV